jgi:hypothetical protein
MRARFALSIVAALAFASSLHCAKNADATFDPDGGPPPEEAGPPPGSFTDANAPPPKSVECAEETKQIFVLGTDKTLYRFEPEKLKFVRIGAVGCPTAAGTFSMAIDRRGIAYVEYTDGHLYAVDTSTAKCTPTAFKAKQTGFELFGMGYALNGDASNGETLYVAGAGLGSIDTTSFDLKFLGSIPAGRTELTGQGTELFAFNVVSGIVYGLDKTNGATKVTYRTTAIDEQAAFAFAQWGGDFWIFTGNTRSIVTRYSPAEDKSTVVVDDTGMLIVGAGSSTCAPSKPR